MDNIPGTLITCRMKLANVNVETVEIPTFLECVVLSPSLYMYTLIQLFFFQSR